MIDVLLIGGKGTIGSGLRTFLPKIHSDYTITSIDLPNVRDKSKSPSNDDFFIDLDISSDESGLKKSLKGRDLIVYLARTDPLVEMNKMTDRVFKSILDTCPEALVIGSSSVHATGGAYFPFTKEPYSTIAKRKFKNLKEWPKPLSVLTEPCPTGDYGLEKAYVESWCSRLGAIGKNAVAARWGGINENNGKKEEVAYFTVWCHQEDSARFVDACYKTYVKGKLRPGAHYYVISLSLIHI